MAHVGTKKQELHHKMDFYIDNRLVLPRVLLSLGVLKEYEEASALVREVEGFLGLVTKYQRNYACVFCYEPESTSAQSQFNNWLQVFLIGLTS